MQKKSRTFFNLLIFNLLNFNSINVITICKFFNFEIEYMYGGIIKIIFVRIEKNYICLYIEESHEQCNVAMKWILVYRYSLIRSIRDDHWRQSLGFRENCARLSFAFLKSRSIVTAYQDLVIREILLVSSLQRANILSAGRLILSLKLL